MLHPVNVKPGTKFIDHGMLSQPSSHRVHRIVELVLGGFRALHVATGVIREFTHQKSLDELVIVPGAVDAMANLDWLVGEDIRLTIIGTGTTITGRVTAVTYRDVPYITSKDKPRTLRFLDAIELDKSMATTYTSAMVERIELLG